MTYRRPPAVAGLFYPRDPRQLEESVTRFVADAAVPPGGLPPKALIVPHAGYVYSGPVAASGYARIASARDRIERVVLLGPAHRVWVDGLAAHGADAFETPLGSVPLDPAPRRLPGVVVHDEAHAQEHSLEVHVPFLQVLLGEFVLAPLLVGDADHKTVADAIEALWGGPETLVVISSDLSHYHDYEAARKIDAATAAAITSLRLEDIGPNEACGCRCVAGMLEVARRRALRVEQIDLRNSGDTAGDRSRVVGYGTFAVT